jgi:hypothetical protein
VTVQFRLPSISQSDDTVYAILTLMSRSGIIMQVATGLYPGMTSWRTYVLLLGESDVAAKSYTWVVNGSDPTMDAGSNVSLSIYWKEGSWRYRVVNLETSGESDGPIAGDAAAGFKSGDQEVIALESYTSATSVFAGMGLMDVYGIEVDGAKVNGGLYSLGGWDPQRSPLFIVGGHEPPSFASISLSDGTVEWSYSAEGRVSYLSPSGYNLALFVIASALIAVSVLTLDFWQRKKRTN